MAKKTARQRVVKRLDDITSKYIRERDAKCVQCQSTENLTNGHVFSRRSYSTRWDISKDGNCHCQCWGCNFKHSKDNYDYFIISDVRYDDYEKDEVHWLQNELEGVLVHVQLYWIEQRLNGHKKVFQEPVNSEEARNDPKLLQKCDFDVTWEKFSDINKDKYTKEYAVKFVEWLTLGNGRQG